MFPCCPLALVKPRMGTAVQLMLWWQSQMARAIQKTIPAQKSYYGKCSIGRGMNAWEQWQCTREQQKPRTCPLIQFLPAETFMALSSIAKTVLWMRIRQRFFPTVWFGETKNPYVNFPSIEVSSFYRDILSAIMEFYLLKSINSYLLLRIANSLG